jgi:hypothetical protein
MGNCPPQYRISSPIFLELLRPFFWLLRAEKNKRIVKGWQPDQSIPIPNPLPHIPEYIVSFNKNGSRMYGQENISLRWHLPNPSRLCDYFSWFGYARLASFGFAGVECRS